MEAIYNRSLKLLKQFISETPSDELASLISKYESLDIKGPTFDEYLGILQLEKSQKAIQKLIILASYTNK